MIGPQQPRSRRFVALLQDGFVIWVLLGALWGYVDPAVAAAGRAWIPEALGLIMLGMGLTLTVDNLRSLKTAGWALVAGVLLQFLVMPLAGWAIASILGLAPMLALGVVLVGASPGGTASNVVTFLARGDVALSVAMTTVSTMLSPLLTPMWVWLLASQWVPVQPGPLFLTVAKIVLLPVLAGIVIRRFWRPGEFFLNGLLPIGSMVVIAWIVGVIVALNHDRLLAAVVVVAAVVLHNLAGLVLGYGVGGLATDGNVARRRAVALEVGMQNSGLAVALAVAHFDPLAAVPGAIFSIWHNVTGPLLATIWRRQDPEDLEPLDDVLAEDV